MYRNREDHAWCTNPDCRHFSEHFLARWVDDTWEDPGYYLDEECPLCASPWVDEQPDADALAENILYVLELNDLAWPQPDSLNSRSLLTVIKLELARQRTAERKL